MTQPTARIGESAGPVDAARQQATEVSRHASEKGSQLAGTAAGQAKQVTGEAERQARDLIGEARSQLGGQALAQQRRVADGLRSLVNELTSMAANGGQSGPATELAHQAAERVRQVASWLDNREPGDLVGEVRRLGRQHPGTFLLGAVLAGVVVGRLTRGAVEAASSTSSGSEGTTDQVAAPLPAVSGYERAPSPPAPPFSAPGLGVGPDPQGQV